MAVDNKTLERELIEAKETINFLRDAVKMLIGTRANDPEGEFGAPPLSDALKAGYDALMVSGPFTRDSDEELYTAKIRLAALWKAWMRYAECCCDGMPATRLEREFENALQVSRINTPL